MTLADRAMSAISRASGLDSANAAVKIAEAQVYAILAVAKQLEFFVDVCNKAIYKKDADR